MCTTSNIGPHVRDDSLYGFPCFLKERYGRTYAGQIESFQLTNPEWRVTAGMDVTQRNVYTAFHMVDETASLYRWQLHRLVFARLALFLASR